MHPVFQILKKDLYCTRWQLGLWGLLIALQYTLIGTGTVFSSKDQFQLLSIAILWIVPIPVLLTIIPVIIQAGTPVATSTFWLAHPTRGLAMFAAKLLYLAVALILPVLTAEMITFAALGTTPEAMALAIPEIILNQLCYILPIALLAALSANRTQLVIFCILLAMAIAAIWFIRSHCMTPIFADWPSYFDLLTPLPHSLMASTMVAARVWMVLACGATMAHQYLTRQTWRSWLLVAACAVVFWSLPSWWSWDFLSPAHTDKPPFATTPVQVTLHTHRTKPTDDLFQDRPRSFIDFSSRVTDLPAGYLVAVKATTPRLSFPDGTTLAGKRLVVTNSELKFDSRALESALGGLPVLTRFEFWDRSDILGRIEVGDSHLLGAAPLTATTDVEYIVFRYRITASTPLKVGSRIDLGSEHLTVESFDRKDNDVWITLHQRKAQLLFDRSWHLFYQRLYQRFAKCHYYTSDRILYLLLHRQRQIAFTFYNIDMFNPLPSRQVNRSIQLMSTIRMPPFNPAEYDLLRVELTPVAITQQTVTATLERTDKPKSDLPLEEQEILQRLITEPALIDTVISKGWLQDAREILMKRFDHWEKGKDDLPPQWIAAIAALRDPTTSPYLQDYVMHCKGKRAVCALLKDYPHLCLPSLVTNLWHESQMKSGPDQQEILLLAMEFGRIDALEEAFKILRETAKANRTTPSLVSIRNLMRQLTPATGDDAALVAWFDTNRDKLVFDPQAKKYRVRTP